MANKLRKLETVIVVLILLYSMGIWWHVQIVDHQEGAISPGGGIMSLINLGIYLFTLIVFLLNIKHFLYVITRDQSLLILVGVTLLSFYWTSSVESTIGVGKGLFRVTALGAYLATRYTLKEQIRLFSWALGIAALLSMIVCLTIPSQGIQEGWLEDMGWRGVFFHKNHLGLAMVLSSGTFLLLVINSLKNSLKNRLVLWVGFSLSFSLLVLSNSKTALLSFFFLLMLFPFLGVLRQKSYNFRMFFFHILSFLAGILFILGFSFAEAALDSLGKDLTLTGRVPLWTLLLEKLSKRPFLGYGYSGFWPSDEGSEVSSQFIWAGHAHNGFLEVALNLGLLGLLVLVINLSGNYLRAISYARFEDSIEALWPLQVMLIVVLANLTLGSIFLSPSYLWMLYVSTNLSLSLYCHRKKRISRHNSLS